MSKLKKADKSIKDCQACGYVKTALNPLVVIQGKSIHKSHLTGPNSGFYQK